MPEQQESWSIAGKVVSGEGREMKSGDYGGMREWDGEEVRGGEVELSTCHVLIAADAQLVEEVRTGMGAPHGNGTGSGRNVNFLLLAFLG